MLAHLRVGLFKNFESGSRTMFITGQLQHRDHRMLPLVCLRLRDSKQFRLNSPILWLLPRMMAYAASVVSQVTVHLILLLAGKEVVAAVIPNPATPDHVYRLMLSSH